MTVTHIAPMEIGTNPVPRHIMDKEEVSHAHVVAYNDGFSVPVRASWYMGRSANASVVYCLLWVSNNDMHAHGHGSAGGYGYDKHSAALAEAIRNAGISIDTDIRGTGESREAITAIAEYLTPNSDTIVIGNIR